MAAPSSSKKRKISELRNAVPFCSQSALSSICQEIEKHGMPQQPSENNALLESDGMSRYGALAQFCGASSGRRSQERIIDICQGR